MMILVQNKKIKIISKGDYDWTYKFPQLVSSIESLKLQNAIFDGEIVVFNDKGIPDFQMLQKAINRLDDSEIHYLAFDIIHYQSFNIRFVPLVERKELLRTLLAKWSQVDKSVSKRQLNMDLNQLSSPK